MSARSLSRIAILSIAVIGLLACLVRYQARQETQTAMDESRWLVTYKLQFSTGETMADEPAPSLTIGLPVASSNLEVSNEEFIHPGLTNVTPESVSKVNRELILSSERGGQYDVVAQIELKLRRSLSWGDDHALESLGEASQRSYLKGEEHLPVDDPRIQGWVRQLPPGSAGIGTSVQEIFDHCSNLGTPGKDGGGDSVEWAMLNKRASDLGKVRTFVTLSRAAKIPARLVSGFMLRQSQNATPRVWAELFIEHRWVPFDPAYGYAWRMPVEFIPVRRGSSQAATVTGKKEAKPTLNPPQYSIERLSPETALIQKQLNSPARIFDLTRLPVQTHEVLSLMLLLPLGALITAFFRNVIGIRTFGTFSPALLAMSFIYAAWGTGLVILVVVVVAGWIGRWLLERLHLLMVPRLSIVLTIIIMCVVFCVSLIYFVDPSQTSRGVLLPLVILTILIERFHVTAEEDGYAFALQLVVGTTIVAAFCYMLLKWDYIGRLMLVYPEAHFFTIALFIVLGRYSGYRLAELWRFRDLVKPRET